MNLRDFTKLKERVDSLQREADREEGAFEQDKKRLRTDFACETIKDAERLLSKLKKEEDQLTGQCEQELAALLADFPQLKDGAR